MVAHGSDPLSLAVKRTLAEQLAGRCWRGANARCMPIV